MCRRFSTQTLIDGFSSLHLPFQVAQDLLLLAKKSRGANYSLRNKKELGRISPLSNNERQKWSKRDHGAAVVDGRRQLDALALEGRRFLRSVVVWRSADTRTRCCRALGSHVWLFHCQRLANRMRSISKVLLSPSIQNPDRRSILAYPPFVSHWSLLINRSG